MASAPAVTTPTNPRPLRIDGLVKRFGKLTAVDGISLELNNGECLGLLGPNGAGKSTLIRTIVGRVIPNAGSVSVFGDPADSIGARVALGWVPQELALYPRLTCRENLEAFGQYHGLRRADLRAAVAWCLDWAALADRAGDVVSSLSGGMKRRLNMAAGIIHRPKVTLMDEPTVGVDPQSRNRIFEMIETLRGEGMSISRASQKLIKGLSAESLSVITRPSAKRGVDKSCRRRPGMALLAAEECRGRRECSR
jgi:ABC-2 type transport system ATP-binding protein